MATSLEDENATIKVCSRGHELPKISFILGCFSIAQSNVLCIVVVGSHLWGSCNARSDWDLVIITDDSKSKPINAHKGNIDAWIISVDEYSTFLREHLIQAILTVWVPENLVLLKKKEFDPVKRFSFSSAAMKAAIEKLYDRDTRVAAKHFSKGDSAGGLKIVKHLVRQLGLCVQIIKSGSIEDYTCYEHDTDFYALSWNDLERVLLSKKHSVLEKIS